MRKYFFIFLVTLLLISQSFKIILAGEDCEKISDLDNRLACYEKQKAELNNSKSEFTKKLNDILGQKNKVNSQISSLSSQLNVTVSQINEIDKTLKDISKEIEGIEKNLNFRKDSLSTKINVKNSILKSYYSMGNVNSIELMFGSESISELTLGFQATEKMNSQMLDTIKILSSEITDFEKDKIESEKAKKDLEESYQKFLSVKNNLNSQKSSYSKVLGDLTNKQEDVEDKLDNINESIKKLSEKQQAIIRAKSSEGETGSIGEYEQPDYSLPTPPFKPAFALMSYGAFTHYNGMSQYGAKGRAEAGQSYKDILKFYYQVGVKDVSGFPSTISVKGVGTLDYQKYLYGIAEMPSDWPIEALKAQAIAARSYAYKASKPICITESCQVYNASKAAKVPAKWKQAVDETKGQILDNPKTSQYSSTTGGYSNGTGWDIKGGAWPGSAYEKIAGSPWFYKAWYTQGYSTSSSTCGRNTPWLSEKEMVDLLNAWVVWRKGSSSDKERISPSINNCFGGNPFSTDAMAEKAEGFGEKYTNISSVDSSISNNGQTTSVTFNTNRGKITIEGSVFKTVVNLRAPGYVSLKSRLFDIEMKN